MKKKIHRDMSMYKDMLDMPRHISGTRAKMPLRDRAAQFSPFSAVVGHETAVKEAARYTDRRRELDEMEKAIIDEKLREIETRLPDGPEVEIIYFVQDELKAGGEYVSVVGSVKKLNGYEREILMMDGTVIAIDEIYSIST